MHCSPLPKIDTSTFMMWRLQELVSFALQLQTAALPSVVIAGVVCLCFWLFAPLARPIESYQNDPVSLDLSIWKQARRWQQDAVSLVQEAYTAFPGKVFQVYSRDGPEVFIPPNMMEEIKALPDSVLSISDGVREFFQTEHTLFPDPGHQEWTMWIKQSLGKNIAKYAGIVVDVLPACMSIFFPENDEGWQEIALHPRLCLMVANIFARIFVGPVFPTEWIFASISYTKDVFYAIHRVKVWPARVRFLFKYLNPSMWTQWKHINTAARVVKQSLSRPAAGDAAHDVNNMLPEDKKKDYVFQGRAQLGLAVAAIHTTVRVICQVIFDLAEHPEYVAAIRGEIKGVLKAEKGTIWTVENLALLKKLDSVMKESMRLHGGGVILQPLTLSDGTYLPPGTFVYAPTHAISHDASIFPDPERFDGLRFYKLRKRSPAEANRHQFTTIDNAVTYFGAGRHACPGRNFAGVLAKMIIVTLIMRYDFKMIEGDNMPRDVPFKDGLVSVNTRKLMMIRDRID